MTAVARLVTTVDLRAHPAGAAHASISARHEAVLADGRHVLVLDDRGWSFTAHRAGTGDGGTTLDPWVATALEEIEFTARAVVGPDEPRPGESQEDAATAHWAYLADLLAQRGVQVEPQELARLPHDVVVGELLRARIGGGASG
jgi:hypothetical protein